MKWLTGSLLLCSMGMAAAGKNAPVDSEVITLAQLAARAHLVVLAQVRDTDYVYRREFPVDGSAFLKVLIAYKSGQAGDIIEVYEKGLHDNECYFPNPTVLEEGRRYLLFLKEDSVHPERYRGLDQGCALDVLVDSSNRYVLRLPVSGIRLADPLNDMDDAVEFADPYALEDDESLPPLKRKELLAAGWLAPKGDRYIYTRGVALSKVRKLMGENGDSPAARQKSADQL